ncbi:MAG: hypothetical protein CMH58_10350 [Myxococcales bacterium]|nr:hypothetical protein [Myxococcales bacterium]
MIHDHQLVLLLVASLVQAVEENNDLLLRQNRTRDFLRQDHPRPSHVYQLNFWLLRQHLIDYLLNASHNF